jgi:hypothetical protein
MRIDRISFNCHGNSKPSYSCDRPGDNSGVYVRSEQVSKLEQLRDLVLWLNECRSLRSWTRARITFNVNNDQSFKRCLDAHCSLHKSIRAAEKSIYEWNEL